MVKIELVEFKVLGECHCSWLLVVGVFESIEQAYQISGSKEKPKLGFLFLEDFWAKEETNFPGKYLYYRDSYFL